MDAAPELLAEPPEQLVKSIDRLPALFSELFHSSVAAVGSQQQFLMTFRESRQTRRQCESQIDHFFGGHGFGFIREQLQNLITEHVPMSPTGSDGGQTLEPQNDLGPGQKSVLVAQLSQFLPHDDAGFLQSVINSVPGWQNRPRKSPQSRLMLHKKPHELAFGELP